MYSSFAPHVRNYLQALLEYAVQNLKTTHAVRVISAGEGGPRDGTRQFCDRFKLLLPYAGQSVTWEVIFQAHRPEFPPDFIFDDMSFLPKIEDIPGLWDWDADDDGALVKVVFEMLDEYRKHQASLLDDFPRLQFEYSSLVHQSDIPETNIQVHLNRKNPGSAVRFWITLPVDFSRLPPVFTKENLSEDTAILQVTFQTPEGSRILPQLFLSPRVEEGLGGTMSLKIPAFSKDGCLMDYVPLIYLLSFFSMSNYNLLIVAILLLCSTFSHFHSLQKAVKKDLALPSLAAVSGARDLALPLLVAVSIPRSFPHDKPSLTFQSAYHASGGWPYTITCTDYPYSPRWDPGEMADRARIFVTEYVPNFQSSSVKNR
ncbi:protein BRE, putative [Ixodes scapularis]|uniref:BRISC and BRCA1-A complex member 2 n=1 Tax=Ixodes scapularis TaxID=6945 RepID=B7QKM7_IXOSC|nr:protein BRE, putative [Ixodes scapularis]|eukprot:XP_002415732.1 protein BRE, putative [Ixodes scapularis]